MRFVYTNMAPQLDLCIYSFYHFFNFKVQVIKRLSVLVITYFCLYTQIFMASTTLNFLDVLCYNIHAYNVVPKLWQNKNYDN